MKLTAPAPQEPDTKPGHYFVSCIVGRPGGRRVALLAGPFVNDHARALSMVEPARTAAGAADPRAIWYAFGTARLDADHPRADRPGVLNAALGIAA